MLHHVELYVGDLQRSTACMRIGRRRSGTADSGTDRRHATGVCCARPREDRR